MGWPAAALLAVVAVGLLGSPALGSAGARGVLPAAAPTAASTGLWAWGAFDNTSYQTEYLGAYIDTLNSTTGNLSSSAAIAAEVEASHALYEDYVVVNATAPAAGVRAVTVSAVAVATSSFALVIAGDLPAAGTYSNTSAVPLVNTTSVFWVTVQAADLYRIASNYTYANGSLALSNEQIASWAAVNETAVAYHWPSYTMNANGTETVAYATVGSAALTWAAATYSANFTPALTLVEAPLTVGAHWNDSTRAHVTGWSGWAVATALRSNATNTSAYTTGVTSLNATASLGYNFSVVRAQSVAFPNGTTGTAYTIDSVQNGSTGGTSYTLWDGLVLLPSGTALPPAAALRPSVLLERALPAAVSSVPTSQAIVTSAGFPVAADSEVASGTTLSAAPLSAGTAEAKIGAVAPPARPAAASAPVATGTAPTTSSTTSTPGPTNTNPPTSSNPPPAPRSPIATVPPAKSAAAPFEIPVPVLALLVAGIAAAVVAVNLVRSRSEP